MISFGGGFKGMSEAPIPNTTPKEQFEDEVLPAYNAYMADKNCQWKARCATYMLGHFAEHVWYYYRYYEDEKTIGGRKKPETFVNYLAKEHDRPELKYVWRTAVISKHRFREKPDKLRNINKSPGNYVEKSQMDDWGTATNAFSRDLTPGSTGAVAPLPDGDGLWMPQYDRRVDDVLKKVVDFWTEWVESAPIHS